MKTSFRTGLLEKRKALPLARREWAKEKLFRALYPLLREHTLILSFQSFPSEIDLSALNEQLAKEGRVIFPEDPLSLKDISIALVPGVGFDLQGHRLGYGKGFYDKLLQNTLFLKWGVGFHEQLVEKLPIEAHDVKLDAVYLF